MLTVEMLKANPILATLGENVLTAIAEMSSNDEQTVISTKIGALHSQYDADILAIAGIAKTEGEKSHDYAKRVLNDYKTKLNNTSTIQAQLTNALNEVQSLKDKLAAGSGDETLKQQLKDANAQVKQLQKSLADSAAAAVTATAKHAEELNAVHVDYAFKNATSGLKFKSGIPESVQKVLLESVKAEILQKGKPELIDDGNGGKRIALRGQDGNLLNNPKNNLNPYTVEELVSESSIKDVIDTTRVVTGTGTTIITPKPGASSVGLDFSAVKTQIDADKLIETHLLSQGLTRDSVEFSDQLMAIRTENNISSLPLR